MAFVPADGLVAHTVPKAHSQPQTAERLSGKREHKPKSGGNMKKIEGGSDETESAPSA